MNDPVAIDRRTPAKINLGLEIIGRRPDGYHDLATVFQAILPEDRLTLAPSNDLTISVSDPALAGPDNLALRALALLRARHGGGCAQLTLEKAIPAAGGLGGASSDAAAALLAGRDLWSLPVSDAVLHERAAELGSDVPFFLRGGCAAASGKGEMLDPLPAPEAWFVVVAPPVRIERKTATLYAALLPEDFSDGSAVRAQVERLRRGLPLDTSLLVNAFSRPLLRLRPELADLRAIMTRAGAAPCLSGAGPAHYAVFDDPAAATAAAFALRDMLGPATNVWTSPGLPSFAASAKATPSGGPN